MSITAKVTAKVPNTMGGSSSVSSTDSLWSKYSRILVENGVSWSQASALLSELRHQLEDVKFLVLKLGAEASNLEEDFDDNSLEDTEEEEGDSE